MDKCLFISKSALLENIRYYSQKTCKDIIAVIKNNAYGHGVKEIVSILEVSNIKMYAVSNIDEAIDVRKYTNKDILIMDKIEDIDKIDENMIITVISKKHLLELIKLDKEIRVHLKINVAMKRKGIDTWQIKECLDIIGKSKLILDGVYTHYSTHKLKKVKKQFCCFKKSLEELKNKQIIIHASSSISSLVLNENITNAIRVGVGMYGLKKLVKEMDPLKITTELKGEIKNSYKIKRLDKFSYDNTYFGKKGYIVMMNIGYGDGLFYKKRIKGYVDGEYIKEIGVRNMDNMYFYSPNYIIENSIVEIYGKHIKLDKIAKTNKIAVCRLLALLNTNIKKQIIS